MIKIKRLFINEGMGIGDWGLGIAQSPIPNPQSPIKSYFQLRIII